MAPADVSGSAKVAGELLGERYRLGRELARGGMGVVHEAEHTTLGHRVAVKFLSDDGKDDPSRPARFLREARAAASLQSPHVARVIDFGTSNGRPFIVMERLEGEDLAALLDRRGPVGVDEALLMVLQVCEAMNEAHARGIVHRDLKPANVFVTKSSDGMPFVKVLDFGLAKVDESGPSASPSPRTSANLIFGTPQYMSPEQLKSSSNVDARADVWSIGVLLHQLLTGEPPFGGTNLSTVIAAVLMEAPRPASWMRGDVPAELDDLVLRCLEKDVAQRVQSVAEIARALSSIQRAMRERESFRGELVTQPLERTSETPMAFTPDEDEAPVFRMPSRSWSFAASLLLLLGVGISGVRAKLASAPPAMAPTAFGVSAEVQGAAPLAPQGLVAQPSTPSAIFTTTHLTRTPDFEVGGSKLAVNLVEAPPPLAAPPPPTKERPRAAPVRAPAAPRPTEAARTNANANANATANVTPETNAAGVTVVRKVKLGGK